MPLYIVHLLNNSKQQPFILPMYNELQNLCFNITGRVSKSDI